MNGKLVVAFVAFCLITSALPSLMPVGAASKTLTVPDEYSTINSAIQNAVDGDTVIVKPGTYRERLTIDKAITLKGSGSDQTTINGGNAGTVILVQHDNVEISGFTIIYDQTPNSPKSIWMWSTRLAGIHLLNVKGCNIHDNRVLDCGGGIWLYGSSQNRVANNYVYRNDYGIRVESSSSNTLEGNNAVGNWAGLSLFSSSNNSLHTNSMSGNTENLAVTGDNPSFINYVDSSNTVESKPVYYWIDKSHQTIPKDAGCVILLDCTAIEVQGLSLTKNHDGIITVNCLNVTVANNNIAETNGGVTTHGNRGGSVTGNTINCINAINVEGDGCQISRNNIIATNTGVGSDGNYNSVTGNTVSITAWQGNLVNCKGSYNTITDNWLNGTSYVYARLEGSNNFFYQNTMLNCYQVNVNSSDSVIAKNTLTGITVSGGSNTSICGNKISNGLGLCVGGLNNQYYANEVSNNYYVGVEFYGNEQTCANNTIYHNNFINNQEEVKNIGKNMANSWDNGAEGNYWSRYTGVDANHDGKGDTPYVIMTEALDEVQRKMVPIATGQDNYPLMAPFNILSVAVELPTWTYNQNSAAPTSSDSNNNQDNSSDNSGIETASPTQSQIQPSTSPQENQATQNQPVDQKPIDIPTNYFLLAAVAAICLIGLALFIFTKRNNRQPLASP